MLLNIAREVGLSLSVLGWQSWSQEQVIPLCNRKLKPVLNRSSPQKKITTELINATYVNYDEGRKN